MATPTAPFELSVTLGNASFSASGDASLVLQTFAEFKELASTSGAPTKPRTGTQKTDPAPEAPAAVKSPTNLPLKPFLATHTLRGNKEKATAVLAWSAESGAKQKLSIGDVETLWKRTGFRTPANLNRDVRAAEKEGWIDSEKSGKDDVFFINGYGEDTVAGWAKGKG